MYKRQLENKPVRVLRDTGCSAVIVRGSLVSGIKLTGQEAMCVLIDGSIRRAPVAQVFLDTPYFTGVTDAVCMENPLYDVVVGNIPGATDPATSLVDLGSERIATFQEEDPSLQPTSVV